MKRLLTLWMTLFAAFWFTRTVTSALLVQEVARDYGSLFQLVVIPLLQTLVIGWLTRPPGREPLLPPWRRAVRHPAIGAALALDLVAVGLSWKSFAVTAAWVGLQLAAAGALAARIAARRDRDRGWIAALAAALLACGPLIAVGVPRYLGGYLLPEQPALAQWLAVYAPLAVLGVSLALQAQKALGPAPARWLDLALGLGLLAGMSAVLGLFARPYLAGPWGFAAALCTALAGTALLAGLLHPISAEEPVIESDHAP
jgi:hypothetical protein